MVVRMLVNCTETDDRGTEHKFQSGDLAEMPENIATRLVDLGVAAFAEDESSPPCQRSRKDLTAAAWEKKD